MPKTLCSFNTPTECQQSKYLQRNPPPPISTKCLGPSHNVHIKCTVDFRSNSENDCYSPCTEWMTWHVVRANTAPSKKAKTNYNCKTHTHTHTAHTHCTYTHNTIHTYAHTNTHTQTPMSAPVFNTKSTSHSKKHPVYTHTHKTQDFKLKALYSQAQLRRGRKRVKNNNKINGAMESPVPVYPRLSRV